MHRSNPREVDTAEVAGDDRDEVKITPPGAKGSHASRAHNIEPIRLRRNGTIESLEQIVKRFLRRRRQQVQSLTDPSLLLRRDGNKPGETLCCPISSASHRSRLSFRRPLGSTSRPTLRRQPLTRTRPPFDDALPSFPATGRGMTASSPSCPLGKPTPSRSGPTLSNFMRKRPLRLWPAEVWCCSDSKLGQRSFAPPKSPRQPSPQPSSPDGVGVDLTRPRLRPGWV